MAEDSCLAHELNVAQDRTTVQIVEHFDGSSALMEHIIHGFSPYIEA